MSVVRVTTADPIAFLVDASEVVGGEAIVDLRTVASSASTATEALSTAERGLPFALVITQTNLTSGSTIWLTMPAGVAGTIVSYSLVANVEIATGTLRAKLQIGGVDVGGSACVLFPADAAGTVSAGVAAAPNTLTAGQAFSAVFITGNTAAGVATLTVWITPS